MEQSDSRRRLTTCKGRGKTAGWPRETWHWTEADLQDQALQQQYSAFSFYFSLPIFFLGLLGHCLISGKYSENCNKRFFQQVLIFTNPLLTERWIPLQLMFTPEHTAKQGITKGHPPCSQRGNGPGYAHLPGHYCWRERVCSASPPA